MTLSHLVPIGHLQELGICVPCTLPLGVECELVVTPICTNSFKKNKWRGEVRPCTAKYIQQDQMNIVISQFHNHAQYLKGKNSGGPLDNQTWYTNSWPEQKLPEFGSRTHTTSLRPMEQFSILSAKFDCPVSRQNISLLATAHDCETGLL